MKSCSSLLLVSTLAAALSLVGAPKAVRLSFQLPAPTHLT